MRAALRNCRTDGFDDLEVVRRTRVYIRHLHNAIAVPGPDFFGGGNQHPVWSLAVWRRWCSVARTCKPGNPAGKQIVFGIDDVDAEIRSIRKIKALRA